uniref:Uncharacterized protein n=1 Tax=Utricularia reniformis TaxID=192314 RepID=A0A1Y0B027_9LAMI|nr:hypothetical protein AEK19_MT0482 [Utricularia reniformis]ART30739.1 hypothetical protein AEK19_MT0482 [Utricularia reniformis]
MKPGKVDRGQNHSANPVLLNGIESALSSKYFYSTISANKTWNWTA